MIEKRELLGRWRSLPAMTAVVALSINALPSHAAFTATSPSTTQVSLISQATCEQQLDNVVIGLTSGAFVADGLGIGVEAVGEALQPLTNPGAVAGVVAQGAALILSVAAFAFDEDRTAQLPYCEETFAGSVIVTGGGASVTGDSIFNNNLDVTGVLGVAGGANVANGVTVSSGGINVTGNSTFNNNLAVTGNMTVGGTLGANSLNTTQGISAYAGAMWIGNTNGSSFQPGISIGGGALAGVGTGGLASLTGHAAAIAIGNNSNAALSGSVAIGLNSSAGAANGLALGTGASAGGLDSVAFGTAAKATQAGAVAVGQGASATGANAVAIGRGASATGSIAMGAFASAANGGAAYGDGATATGTLSTALGPNANATFANSVAIGSNSVATADSTVSFGTPGNERRLMNVAEGLLGFDAVNVNQLTRAVNKLNRGLASSTALSTPMMALDQGETGVSFGSGFYEGETGIALRVAHRLNTESPMMISGSISTAGNDSTVGQLGVGFKF